MKWKLVRLGDAITTKKGFAFKSNLYVDSGIPIVRVSNFTGRSISDDDLKYYPTNVYKNYLDYVIHENDIIIQTVGSWQNNPDSVVGKVVRVPYYLDGALLNQNAVKLSPIENFDNNYLFYRLCCKDFQGHVIGEARGAANQASITLNTIKTFVFYAPCLCRQQRISSFLNAYDKLIENNQKQIKLLEEAAQRLYKEWFIDLRFPGHETTPIVNGIPEGWRKGMISEIVEYYDKIRKPLSSIERKAFQGKYKYYGAAGVLDHVKEFLYDGTFLLMGEDGTVINPNGTPVLQYVSGKFWVNNHAHVLKGKKPYSTEFVYMMFNQLQVTDIVTGVAQPKISQARLNQKGIIIPSIGLVLEYSKKTDSIFKSIILLSERIEILQQARDRLLPKLMSGEIEV